MSLLSLIADSLAAAGPVPDVASTFARFADFFWDSSVFESDRWERWMNALRIGLTMGGALLLMYEVRARKMGERYPERSKRHVGILLTVLAFGAYFNFFNPNVRYSEYYHRHEFYHYYLGSKYF